MLKGRFLDHISTDECALNNVFMQYKQAQTVDRSVLTLCWVSIKGKKENRKILKKEDLGFTCFEKGQILRPV